MLDLDACERRGVAVTNVPASATEEVAVHALTMGLSLLRGLPFYDRSTKQGVWDVDVAPGISRPSTLTLGILGLCRIGQRLAKIAQPIFGRIIGYDPIDFEVPGVERASLDEVIAASDVLSLHLPLTPESYHLRNAERIAQLPRGARVVKVSRGALIDPNAMVAALDSGHVGAVAVDVLETEPPVKDDPFVNHPNVLVSPHAAFLSPESAMDYLVHQANNAISMIQDGKPLTPIRT